MTELSVLSDIEDVVKVIAPQFRFGYYTLDDIKQTARLFAIQGLENYDCQRPLKNFLYCHIKNRLINLRRDKLHRSDPPCHLCNNRDSGKTSHVNGQYCKKFLSWQKRNDNKRHIMNFGSTPRNYDKPTEGNLEQDIQLNDILSLIDQRLDPLLRESYLKMRDGVKISTKLAERVTTTIKGILWEFQDKDKDEKADA